MTLIMSFRTGAGMIIYQSEFASVYSIKLFAVVSWYRSANFVVVYSARLALMLGTKITF